MTSPLPANTFVSRHPCVRAKMSQLRSQQSSAREVKTLIHDISLIVGAQALMRALEVIQNGTDTSPLGYEYPVETVTPGKISLMPILRSGLGMIDALQTLLPEPVPVHHLGMFRDKTTMTAVEYYNNLPYHQTSTGEGGPSDLVILVDPVIATGATACAAIETLKDWGVKKIVMICIISSEPGLRRAAEQWSEGVDVWAGAMDEQVDAQGMIVPGLGDVGDRLFLTIGK